MPGPGEGSGPDRGRGLRLETEPQALRPSKASPSRTRKRGALLAPAAEDAKRALLAVSGGPDSVALMRLLARLSRAGLDCEVEVATVDHGLRPGSRQEAERVRAWAMDCGFPHHLLSWEGAKPKTRIQEKARAARYELLAAKAREIGAGVLITAHTQDDQAETVLMRLAHGSGLAGLAGMRMRSKRDGIVLARPFLGTPKARLVATCEANGWPYVADPSNADPALRPGALAQARRRARRRGPLGRAAREARRAGGARRGGARRQGRGGLRDGRDRSAPERVVLDMERLVARRAARDRAAAPAARARRPADKRGARPLAHSSAPKACSLRSARPSRRPRR